MTYHYPEPIPANLPKVAAPMLGTWALISHQIIKCHNADNYDTDWQRWQLSELTKMMFFGVRQVRCGNMVTISVSGWNYDEPPEDKDVFQSKRFIVSWLFVETAHKKPVHCLPMDCEILPF